MRGRFRYAARQPLDTFRQIRFSGSRAQVCPFPVKDQRKQFFFWLGVVVLPLFFIDVIGVLSPIMLFVDRIGGYFEWPWLLLPLVLALVHLAVEPIDRLRSGQAQAWWRPPGAV